MKGHNAVLPRFGSYAASRSLGGCGLGAWPQISDLSLALQAGEDLWPRSPTQPASHARSRAPGLSHPLSVSPSHSRIAYGMGKQPTKAWGCPAPRQTTATWPRASYPPGQHSLRQ
jgi:hypothetical protein